MFNVWLAGDHLYGKWLFTRLSLVMSLMVPYFVLSFFHEISLMRSGTECEFRVVVFGGAAPKKTGPKDGTKFCVPRKMLQT